MLALVDGVVVEKGLMLQTESVVYAILISAPGSTKNNSGSVIRKCVRCGRAPTSKSEWKLTSAWVRSQALFTRSLARDQMYTTYGYPKLYRPQKKADVYADTLQNGIEKR